MDTHTQSGQSQQIAALGSAIDDANVCIDTLMSLLDKERDALTSGDVDEISNNVKLKVECVAQLEQLDNTRADLCRSLSLANDDIDDYLATHDANYTAGAWQTLLINLQQCRDSNAVNGSVTRVRRSHIEKALSILRGGDFAAPALYGPDGLEHVKDVTNLGQA